MKISVNLHASNINGKGLGSTNIFLSFIPQFLEKIDRKNSFFILSKSIEYRLINYLTEIPHYFHVSCLPNFLYRFLECTFLTPKFINTKNPLLTFGDLPLRYKGKQTLFLQNILIINCQYTFRNFKFLIMNLIFRINLRYVNKFIVQTEVMRNLLVNNYNISKSMIDIIYFPPSEEIIKKKNNLQKKNNSLIKLFYPSSAYHYKNHFLISKINDDQIIKNCQIYLTINEKELHLNNKSMIKFLGTLDFKRVIDVYEEVNALLFLSDKESYGLPLVEAMFLGLHIICPDLEYTRELCGDEAIYFENLNSKSLEESIKILIKKVENKDETNWSKHTSKFETDWEIVAKKFLSNLI